MKTTAGKSGYGSRPDEGNLKEHLYSVTPAHRSALKHHRACVLWLTGLSGSGKSTIAGELDVCLYKKGIHTQVLDGDNLRLGLNADLGFSRADRKENIRRAGEVARLSAEAGLVVIAAFISPYRADRAFVRSLFPPDGFIEVFVDCPLAICRKRDPKGFYRRAKRREIKKFTGIQAPFEAPLDPEITVRTDLLGVKQSARKIIAYLEKNGMIPRAHGRKTKAGLKESACS
jgi:adenylylsulfate kinase